MAGKGSSAHCKEGKKLQQIGAQPVLGDVNHPLEWIREAQGASALIDLVQPKLPQRLTRIAIQAVSMERQGITKNVFAALQSLPDKERPVFFSISGADDLQPDAQKHINHNSLLREKPYGFSHIGIPVRKLIEKSGVNATYIYLGNIVYGHGKTFADLHVAGLARGKGLIVGKGTNHLPLSHVTDVARALGHLAGLPRMALMGQTFLIMDGSDTTQRQLVNDTADLMGVKHARAIPSPLGALVVGHIAIETITLDVQVDLPALLQTGFQFTYPSHREGVPATLTRLGYSYSR